MRITAMTMASPGSEAQRLLASLGDVPNDPLLSLLLPSADRAALDAELADVKRILTTAARGSRLG